jgi:hypothetical protein
VQDEVTVGGVGILIEVVDTVGVEEARAPFDAVDFVAFLQQELGKVSAVLAGDSSD